MVGRSKSKNIKAARTKNVDKFDKPESLTLRDVQCSVCMGIFIEPVTLPCYHTTCKVCFERTIDNNSLACPLCRKYVGGWVRQRQKNGLMVNQSLWSHIKQHFDSHVQKKLNGEDDDEIDGLAELNIPAPQICEPGVIREEYEVERKRLEEEAEKLRELEAQASEKLIKELQEKEEEERRHLEELRKKAEEEDALVAQQIAAQLAAEDAARQAENEASSAFVKMQPHPSSMPTTSIKGPMDVFLSQNGIQKTSRTVSTNSTDSLHNEMHHFRPVHFVPTTPPKQSPDGSKSNAPKVQKPVPVMRSLNGSLASAAAGPSSCSLRPWLETVTSSSEASHAEDTPTARDKRMRSPTLVSDNYPKRTRRESPKKPAKRSPDRSQYNHLAKFYCGSTDSYNDSDGHSEGKQLQDSLCVRFNTQSSLNFKHNNSITVDEVNMMPLPFHDLSENAVLEHKYRQEKEDFEYALKLQEEFNLMGNQGRSYELRSVGTTPKTAQMKLGTPRNRTNPKVAASSGKKEKRRQCTLEESMSFSVKMKL